MILRIFLGIGLAVLLTGCATAQKPSALNNLQIKVSQMEKTLEEKDQEILDLKDQLQDLSSQIDNLGAAHASASTEDNPKPKSAAGAASSADDARIIRVEASAFDVQRALKSAGYYSGAVDGKMGAKSRKAISDFQKDHKLNSDGIVGKNTWIELKKYLQ